MQHLLRIISNAQNQRHAVPRTSLLHKLFELCGCSRLLLCGDQGMQPALLWIRLWMRGCAAAGPFHGLTQSKRQEAGMLAWLTPAPPSPVLALSLRGLHDLQSPNPHPVSHSTTSPAEYYPARQHAITSGTSSSVSPVNTGSCGVRVM